MVRNTGIAPATACDDVDALTDGRDQVYYRILSACGPFGADEGAP